MQGVVAFEVGVSVGAGFVLPALRNEENTAVIAISDDAIGEVSSTSSDKLLTYVVLSRSRLAKFACMLTLMSEQVGVPADYDEAAERTRCQEQLAAAAVRDQEASSPR